VHERFGIENCIFKQRSILLWQFPESGGLASGDIPI
jgi:hypothetical protein